MVVWLIMAGIGLSALFRNWSVTPPTATPAAGSSPTPVAVGGWCRNGFYERLNDYIEICVTNNTKVVAP